MLHELFQLRPERLKAEKRRELCGKPGKELVASAVAPISKDTQRRPPPFPVKFTFVAVMVILQKSLVNFFGAFT
jgi:hypothetical protein